MDLESLTLINLLSEYICFWCSVLFYKNNKWIINIIITGDTSFNDETMLVKLQKHTVFNSPEILHPNLNCLHPLVQLWNHPGKDSSWILPRCCCSIRYTKKYACYLLERKQNIMIQTCSVRSWSSENSWLSHSSQSSLVV